MATTTKTELQEAIEEAEHSTTKGWKLNLPCAKKLLIAAKRAAEQDALLSDGSKLLSEKWNLLLPEIEKTFTHKANFNTVKLERDELAKRCNSL